MADGKKCERPLCTCCLVFFWIFALIGTLMSNLALGTLIPAIQDLPANLLKGFDDVFGFARLSTDAGNVKESASNAVALCNENASLICPTSPDPSTYTDLTVVDTTTHKAAIQSAFDSSLGIIQKVSTDTYFGTPAMAETGNLLTNITTQMQEITPSLQCAATVPIYCKIYDAADKMLAEISQVEAEKNKFINGPEVTAYDDNSGDLDFLHVIPWFFITSMLFYCCFWYFGRGLCCCCRGGSCLKTLLIFPLFLFYVLSLIFTLIWVITGFIFHAVVLKTELAMFKGNPTVEEMCNHIKAEFPDFWALVFAEMEKGCSAFWFASIVLLAAIISTVFYEFLVCCCRPYQLPEEEAKANV